MNGSVLLFFFYWSFIKFSLNTSTEHQNLSLKNLTWHKIIYSCLAKNLLDLLAVALFSVKRYFIVKWDRNI